MRSAARCLALAFSLLSSQAGASGPALETWPHGRPFGDGVERPTGGLAVCSHTLPLCVHGDARSGAEMTATLREAERALEALSAQALLPWPMSDGDRGGSPATDIYLVDLPDASFRVGVETPSRMPVDRAPAFALIRRGMPDGCARRTAVHRAVATAMLASVDAGEAGGTFAASAAYLAMHTTGCLGEITTAIDRAQARPERAIVAASALDDPGASILLPWYLDGLFAAGAPGSLLTALWYGGEQSTPVDASRYHNDPDFFRVLGRVAKSKQKELSDVMLDFAIARAFVGDRDDGRHLAESAFLGTFGRVRFDGSWPVTTLPRRLAFTPLEPMGSTYLWVDLAGVGDLPSINLHAEWEFPVTMRWAVVRVGPSGEEVSRVELLEEKGVYKADRTIYELAGLSGLIVVGVNMGEVSKDHPFKIDEAPYEPHGGTVYLFRE